MNDEWNLEEVTQHVATAFSKRLSAGEADDVAGVQGVMPPGRC